MKGQMKVFQMVTELQLTDIWLELRNHVIAENKDHATDLVHNMLPKEFLPHIINTFVEEEIMEI
jgi:hypothetical protein